MKLRQSRDREVLSQVRHVEVGEVDHEIDLSQLEVPPTLSCDPPTTATCERIYAHYIEHGEGSPIPRRCFHDLPIWVFLEYLVAHKGVLLHGSSDAHREELIAEILSQNLVGWTKPAHFAYRSSIESIYAAVLDFEKLREVDCLRKSSAVMKGSAAYGAERRYFYGLDYRALPFGPWRTGTVYFYRSSDFPEDFEQKPFFSDRPIHPVARLAVTPKDWPLIGRVCGIDLVAMNLRTRDTYKGYPWRRDRSIHPHLNQEREVNAMANFLEANLDWPVDLASLGRLVGAGPVTALRMFRANRGLTPHAYHMDLRIKGAKQSLKHGLPIGRVAAEFGFADQSHFIRQFSHDVGLTPGQYLRAQESSIRGA